MCIKNNIRLDSFDEIHSSHIKLISLSFQTDDALYHLKKDEYQSYFVYKLVLFLVIDECGLAGISV